MNMHGRLIAVVAGLGVGGFAAGAFGEGAAAPGSGNPRASAEQAEVRPDAGTWRDEWRARRDAALAADPNLPHDPTSLLVKFTDQATAEDIGLLLKTIGGDTIETWPGFLPGVHHLTTSMRVEDAIEVLEKIGGGMGAVEYAEPDYIYKLGATPNDTFYSLLWGMNNTGQTVGGDPGVANHDIDANLAWDLTTGSSTFVVGVADSGIRRTHQDLTANIWSNPGEVAGDRVDNDGNGRVDDTWGWDFWNNDNNPTDDNGHGSHTSGTIGARGNNGLGVTGVAWTVKLAGLKIGSAGGSVSSSAAASAINYCVGKGIKVSNHSWGGSGGSTTLSNAISAARTAGHLLVCAAGNGGSDFVGDNNDSFPQYPASYTHDNIISVMAIDNDGARPTFSNYGATSVDLAAPGVTIASCYRTNDSSYVYMDGTSMATPHVAGVAALVWSRYPAWTYSQVRSRILSTTRANANLAGRCATAGVVNAFNAVQ
ncbi:MAG TPA: S8 family peptidase [Phycisphaerales bacterium]|nr:S8 family peptidase [Phycisphaerales bacterium]